MNKILVIRYGTIGDNIFASAFYRELRKAEPNAVIDILADKISKGIMKNCPYIDNIIDIDGKYKNFLKYIFLFKKYDTVYFLKNDTFFTQIAFFAGIKNRIGFNVRRNFALNRTKPYNENRHEIDCYLDLLRLSNIIPSNTKTEVWTDNKNNQKIEKFLHNTTRKKVLIHAYSRFKMKDWIDEYWCKVIEHLSDKLDIQVYFTGADKDLEAYQNLIKKFKTDLKHPPINTSGQFSISETIELIKNMDMIISVDTGIIHIAAALDIPSILLHGATSLKRWQPRSEYCKVLTKDFPCSPCCLQSGSHKLCKNRIPKCMKALTPDMVINILDKKFAGELIF